MRNAAAQAQGLNNPANNNMAMSRDEKNREAAKKLTFRQLAVLNDLRFALSTTREPRFETFIGQYMDYLKNVRQAQEIIDQDPAQSLDILRNTDKTYDELIHSLLLLGSEGRIHAEALRAQLEQQIHTLRLLQAALLGLAVLLAIQSSLRGRALPQGFIAFGEVGLAGEVRPAPRGQERLREAAKLGFSVALVPKANMPKKPIEGLTLWPIERIDEAIARVRELD